MTRYKMDDGTIVDTEKAVQSWSEESRWNGSNHISVNTDSQWHHQHLYLSRKERYYIEHSSDIQGQSDSAEFIDEEDAVRWLLFNEKKIPESLKQYEEQVIE